MNRSRSMLVTFVAVVAGLTFSAGGQTSGWRPFCSNLIVPQSSTIASGATGRVHLTHVDVQVKVIEQVATTTMDVHVKNPSKRQEIAEMVIPVPKGAAIRAFTFQGSAAEPTAELLSRSQAKETFEALVSKLRDPAILEFAGLNLVRTSVFPVPAEGTQTVRITYEHLLPAEGDRVDYELPRSGLVTYDVPWNIQLRLEAKKGIATVYSPSHRVQTNKVGKALAVRLDDMAQREPGTFRLSFLKKQAGGSASMFTYPASDGSGGYFLLLAGIDAEQPSDEKQIKRELTLVIDRSGSMRGEKIVQAQEAAAQVIAGLEPGERFNIIAYNNEVLPFAPEPVEVTRESRARADAFLESLTAQGGTNIHDALLEALNPTPLKDTLPIVMFLTDGRPTVGQTSEQAIRSVATKANPGSRRIFTFGVGVDVNTPLLDKIALETRGFATFVLPGEDVEAKVARVFRGLNGPVLASPELIVAGPQGKPSDQRVFDIQPSVLPDMFAGDQLLVLGRYRGNKSINFRLTGDQGNDSKSFEFTFKPKKKASTKNAFVARLWASRKIASLTDKIRDLGVSGDAAKLAENNPHLKELVDEIVDISTRFGVLTEYTAFLAREGTDLTERGKILSQVCSNYVDRAVGCRWGTASVNQDINNDVQRNLAVTNFRNNYIDANLNQVAITSVQQVNDTAFYCREGRWIQSDLIEKSKEKPQLEIEFGSPEFLKLVGEMSTEGRQNTLTMNGDILLNWRGRSILIRGPKPAATAKQSETQPAEAPASNNAKGASAKQTRSR